MKAVLAIRQVAVLHQVGDKDLPHHPYKHIGHVAGERHWPVVLGSRAAPSLVEWADLHQQQLCWDGPQRCWDGPMDQGGPPQDMQWLCKICSCRPPKLRWIPSRPGIESGFSSLQAISMFCSVKLMSVMLFSVLSLAKNSGGLGTYHSTLGYTNTLLYCLLRCSAVKSGSGLEGGNKDSAPNFP